MLFSTVNNLIDIFDVFLLYFICKCLPCRRPRETPERGFRILYDLS